MIASPIQLIQRGRVSRPAISATARAHEGDRDDEPDHQHQSIAFCGAGDREHVVERHRDVGDDDLDERGRELMVAASPTPPGPPAKPAPSPARRLLKLAAHLPAHPEQQDAAREQQADDREQLRRDEWRTAMRSTTAPPTPQKITLRAGAASTRAAAMPTTTALSPASTRSMMMTCASAMSCWERSMESACLSVGWMD